MKKNILVTYPSHLFFNSIYNHIVEISKDFNIVLGLTKDYLTDDHMHSIEDLLSNNTVSYFFIIDTGKSTLHLYKELLNISSELKRYRFSLWVSCSNIQIHERFIEKFCLSKDCKKVLYWDGVTYLMENESFCKKLLSLPNDNRTSAFHQNKSILKKSYLLLKSGRINQFFAKTLFFIKDKTFFPIEKIAYLYSRFLLPFILFRRSFGYRHREKLTQLTTGNVDAIIFTDKIEVKVHKKLYNFDNVFRVKHSLSGRCKCHPLKMKNNNTILSPLSGIIGDDTVLNEVLVQYLECFKIAMRESGACEIHLRKHPRETGRWPYQLCDFLNNNGVRSVVVNSDLHIEDIACEYLGIAGFASCTLRDVRAACNYAFVVGFEELSFSRYSDPRFLFGDSDGIDWIYSRYVYDKNIFKNKRYVNRCDVTLLDILRTCVK